MKRLFAILLSLSLLTALFGGCASKPVTEAPPSTAETVPSEMPDGSGEAVSSVQDGIYTGTASGYRGDVTVSVTVSKGKIAAVEVLSHSETAGISDAAFATLPNAIVEHQSIAIDTVAGCTFASTAILEAAKEALLSAGFTEDEISIVPEKAAASSEKITKTADVVVVGAGGAGMTAAATAAQNGAAVIILEKMPSIGGNTIVAGSGFNAADPERQQQLTMTVAQRTLIQSYLDLEPRNELMAQWQENIRKDLEAYDAAGSTYLYDSADLHKLMTYSGGDYVAKVELVDTLCDNAYASYQWLTELGATWEDGIAAGLGAVWPRSHTATSAFGASGGNFIHPQKQVVDAHGGEILLSYTAKELIVQDGRVVGVSGVTAEGTEFEITANNGVVLATGGFAANVELRQRVNTIWPDLGENVPTTNPSSSTGDGILMAEAIGANLVGMEYIQLIAIGQPDITPLIDNTISVNQDGLRFVREDGRRDEICFATLEQPGQCFYYIYDAHMIVDILGGKNTHGLIIDDIVDDKTLFKADTLEELAEKMNIPADTLVNTVNEFNSYVEAGGGDPLGRSTFSQKLEKGPFYSVQARVRVHYTMGGVEIDEEARVLDTNSEVIEGLYAAGEVTGGIHGSNRLGGNAIADIITFGRIAGNSASK